MHGVFSAPFDETGARPLDDLAPAEVLVSEIVFKLRVAEGVPDRYSITDYEAANWSDAVRRYDPGDAMYLTEKVRQLDKFQRT